jgi:hypothetical protein
MHAVILALFLYLGCFEARSVTSFVGTLVLAAVWAEIWNYSSHRAVHFNAPHWMHRRVRFPRQFGGLAKVDRVGVYAASFSLVCSTA